MVDLFKQLAFKQPANKSATRGGSPSQPITDGITDNTNTDVGGHSLRQRLRVREPDGTVRPTSILRGGG